MSEKSNRISAAASTFLATNTTMARASRHRVDITRKSNVIRDTVETSDSDQSETDLVATRRPDER